MKEKKNIERLFQENFKDFEVTPHENNWEKIQNRLDKKEKDRKIIPLWFRYAGVAAILLLFLGLLGKSFFDKSQNIPENSVVIEAKDNLPTNNAPQETTNNSIVNTNSIQENSSKDNVEINQNVAEESTDSSNPDKSLFVPSQENKNNTLVTIEEKSTQEDRKSQRTGNNSFSESKNKTAFTNDEDSKTKSTKSNSIISPESKDTKEQIALNANQKKDTQSIDGTKSNSNSNPLSEGHVLEKSGIAKAEDSQERISLEQNPIEEEIALTEIKKDSLTIEEAIALAEEKDLDEKEEEELVDRWQLYASIAPVYYNTLGEGSHLHEQFIHNPKSGEVNTSYGVNVGYAISKKFNVRTGISALNLSYSTADVILYESPGSMPAQASLKNVTVANDSGSHMVAFSSDNFLIQSNSLASSYNTTLTQNISYYEVPVELEYNVVNKKIGLQLIGGVSTFFLDNNEIYADDSGSKSYLGQANNINNVSFSANFGLGLDYNFAKKFKFNLEPTFKYQLNAYNNTSGNFRPYIFGVYTGLSYKF